MSGDPTIRTWGSAGMSIWRRAGGSCSRVCVCKGPEGTGPALQTLGRRASLGEDGRGCAQRWPGSQSQTRRECTPQGRALLSCGQAWSVPPATPALPRVLQRSHPTCPHTSQKRYRNKQTLLTRPLGTGSPQCWGPIKGDF